MARKINDRTLNQMIALNNILQNGEKEQDEVKKMLGLKSELFAGFMCTMTFLYPVYEYKKGNKTYIGVLK